jgi:hypothetical protein
VPSAVIKYVCLPLFGLALLVVGVGILLDTYPSATRITLVATVIAVLVAALLNRLRFWRTGYRAFRHGRDYVIYEERDPIGAMRRLGFDYGTRVGTPDVIYVPDETAWNRYMPIWACGRRREIIGRVQEAFSTSAHEYVPSSSMPTHYAEVNGLRP